MGGYIKIDLANIVTIWLIAALGYVLVGAMASALRSYGR